MGALCMRTKRPLFSTIFMLIIFSLIGFISSYIALNSLLGALVISGIFFLFALWAYWCFIRLYRQIYRQEEGLLFMNNYLVALSVETTPDKALRYLLHRQMPKVEIQTLIGSLIGIDALHALKDYYSSDLYGAFLNLIDIYIERGGNIIVQSEFLLDEIRRRQKSLLRSKQIFKQKISENIILWTISLLTVGLSRWSLGELYFQLIAYPSVFLTLCSVYLLLLLNGYWLLHQAKGIFSGEQL